MAGIELSRIPPFYHRYIQLVPETDLDQALEQHRSDLTGFLQSIPEDKWEFRYSPDKWTVKELVQHVIDAERIFCHRALTFSRKDPNQIPGFDEEAYAPASRANKRSKQELIAELQSVHEATVSLFHSFDEEHLNETGVANGNPVYVAGLGFILRGHALHHKKILKEKYLG